MSRALHRPGRRRARLRARRTRHASLAGFTLLELMVALVAGLVAITAIYYVGGASSQHFHEQQRITQTQMSVRMAMEQLRRDIARAGFFGTPNSRLEQRCWTPAFEIEAIDFEDNPDAAVLPEAATNRVEADRLRLVGNYATGDAYFVNTLDNTGGAAFLQREWQGFRRDFGIVGVDFDDEAFNDVFRPERMLHLQTLQGNHFFVGIQSATGINAQVRFDRPIGVGGTCVGGLAGGALVAPLSMIEYRVVDPDVTPELAAIRSPAPEAVQQATGRQNAVLIRRELNPQTGALIPGTTRVVLEYVANFDLGFVFDDEVRPGLRPNLVRRDDAAAEGQIDISPHHVRSVIVDLAARTAGEDERFPYVARGPNEALTRYEVNPAVTGAARVRSLETEIVLPNLASRNLRP